MAAPHTPTEEWLDVVDSDDRIVGRQRRGEIHRLELRHRATHILVFDREGRLFLQRRSRHKDINAGLWDTSAAGHVDPGESYDECAQRELAEELGIACAARELEPLFTITASAATGWEFIHVYRVFHDGPLHLNPDEIDEGRWIAPAAIDAWEDAEGHRLSATFRDIWARYRALPPTGGRPGDGGGTSRDVRRENVRNGEAAGRDAGSDTPAGTSV